MSVLNITAELSESLSFSRTKSSTITTTGNGIDHRKITVGITEDVHAIDAELTGGAGPGACFIYNADSTNFVSVGFATGNYVLKVLPGTAWVLPLDDGVASLYLLADTAVCEVEIGIREA